METAIFAVTEGFAIRYLWHTSCRLVLRKMVCPLLSRFMVRQAIEPPTASPQPRRRYPSPYRNHEQLPIPFPRAYQHIPIVPSQTAPYQGRIPPFGKSIHIKYNAFPKDVEDITKQRTEAIQPYEGLRKLHPSVDEVNQK